MGSMVLDINCLYWCEGMIVLVGYYFKFFRKKCLDEVDICFFIWEIEVLLLDIY